MSTTILVLIISLIEILNNLYKDLNKIEKSYETLIDKWILKYVEIGKYVLVILLIIHYSTKYYYKLVEFTEWLSQLA